MGFGEQLRQLSGATLKLLFERAFEARDRLQESTLKLRLGVAPGPQQALITDLVCQNSSGEAPGTVVEEQR